MSLWVYILSSLIGIMVLISGWAFFTSSNINECAKKGMICATRCTCPSGESCQSSGSGEGGEGGEGDGEGGGVEPVYIPGLLVQAYKITTTGTSPYLEYASELAIPTLITNMSSMNIRSDASLTTKTGTYDRNNKILVFKGEIKLNTGSHAFLLSTNSLIGWVIIDLPEKIILTTLNRTDSATSSAASRNIATTGYYPFQGYFVSTASNSSLNFSDNGMNIPDVQFRHALT